MWCSPMSGPTVDARFQDRYAPHPDSGGESSSPPTRVGTDLQPFGALAAIATTCL
jgi:hypothetical protein